MSNTEFRKPREVTSDRLARLGQDERSTAEYRAKENLETAVPANVIECAPYRGPIRNATSADCCRKAGEIVYDHFRYAGRARGHEHPFGANASRPPFGHRHGRRQAGATDRKIERHIC